MKYDTTGEDDNVNFCTLLFVVQRMTSAIELIFDDKTALMLAYAHP